AERTLIARLKASRYAVAAVAVGVAIAVGGGGMVAWRAMRDKAPAPPALADLGPLAPEITDIVRQAREAVVQEPRDGARWGRCGMVWESSGLAGPARDACANAAALQPAEPKWPFHLAVGESRLGRSDDAVRDMRRAIELYPSYTPARSPLAPH